MGRTKQLGETLPHPEQPRTTDPMRATFDAEDYWQDETEPVPVDRSKPFRPELYPRQPDEYEPLDHFYQRQKDDERKLERELDGYSAVRKTIRDGELRDNEDGCAVFVLDWYGVFYYVVVGYHLKDYLIAVSGWPMVRDREQALDSGQWLANEIETVEDFNERHFQKYD